MTPTMYLRFNTRVEEIPAGESGMLLRATVERLQQFWHIAMNESDLTLPKEVGPDGILGRWIDVRSERPATGNQQS